MATTIMRRAATVPLTFEDWQGTLMDWRPPASYDTITRLYANTTLTFVPLMVRYPHPTHTYDARLTTNTQRPTSYKEYPEESSEVVSPKLRKLLLGLCIPLGLLLISVVPYIIWYVRHRRKKNKASKEGQAGSPGSPIIKTADVRETENKQGREPTHREGFMTERSGSLPAGSTDDYIQPQAEEERRRLRYQEESLRERRAQLEAEEEALRIKRAQRQPGM